MTRPGIVRADTLDLQDQTAPSSQDHSKLSPQHTDFSDNLIGAHQASEVRQVIRERHSEEQNLHEAWNGNGVERRQLDGDDVDTNGDDARSTADSDAETASDDDMTDRISSSPSIDDGAYHNRSSAQPQRSSSSFALSFDSLTSDGSPASTRRSSSPSSESPQYYPLWIVGKGLAKVSYVPESHHQQGEYDGDESCLDDTYESPGHERKSRPDLGMLNTIRYSPSDKGSFRMYQDATSPLCEASLRHESDASSNDNVDSWAIPSDSESDAGFSDLAIEDDDQRDVSLYSDARFVDSGWGGECLRDIEDIDFDFVYALHTFVATVEGQANATKGDTMVLLDDSNSYWWLVRVVKDSSIGYLPAEHIETPTERLARLNKHRNVDLSAAMLGDNAEKSKNPLKKAMRRRNAKQVQFAAPTYVEASDYEYSSDDEDHPRQKSQPPVAELAANASKESIEAQQDVASVDAASIRSETSTINSTTSSKDIHVPTDEPLASPKLVDKTEAAPIKSRKGNPRNSDSWLREEGGETRRLTLTPNLLREDGGGSPKSINASDSFESLVSSPEKSKDEKKKKEKKSGMLSGLFKNRKKEKQEEKTKKKEFVSDSELEKLSSDSARHSTASLPAGDAVAKGKEVQRRASLQKKGKLQKNSPSTNETTDSPDATPSQESPQFFAELEGSQVAFEAPTGLENEQRAAKQPAPQMQSQASQIQTQVPQLQNQAAHKTTNTTKARQRQALDDFDDSPRGVHRIIEEEEEEAGTEQPTFMHGTESVHIPMGSGQADTSEDEREMDDDATGTTREGSSTPPSLIEPPLEAEKETVTAPASVPMSVKSDDDPTPTPSNPQSPHLTTGPSQAVPFLAHTPPLGDDTREPQRQDSKSSMASSRNLLSPSPASTATTWSDAGLRAWLDGDNDVRDMLVVINDQTGVKPVEKDHPLMANLFAEESKTLKSLSDELDGLLGGFLKGRAPAVQASS